ncbi:arsenate reductase ArsC [Thermodesulfobacteriota bacterium]
MKKKVMFLCVNNSCRSQMAEGLLRHFGGDKFDVFSAGSIPTTVNKNAIKVLKEIGIDISNQRSGSQDDFDLDTFDYIITACSEASDACPVVTADTNIIHLNLRDPGAIVGTESEIMDEFRSVRDEIKEFAISFYNNQ